MNDNPPSQLDEAMTKLREAAASPPERPRIPLTSESPDQIATAAATRHSLRIRGELLRILQIHLTAVRGPEPFIGPRDTWVLDQITVLLHSVLSSNHDFQGDEDPTP